MAWNRKGYGYKTGKLQCTKVHAAAGERGRKRFIGGICLALAAVSACLLLTAGGKGVWAAFSGSGMAAQVAEWELAEALAYDHMIEGCIGQLLQEGVDVLFWKEKELDTVENADYNRSVEVKTMGIAGDASVLFPGSNSLSAGEAGYCLLGEITAYRLFGSTRVNGRKVRIQGKTYHIAGIEYQEKDLCVYELDSDGEAEVAHVAIRYQNRRQLERDKRRLEQVIEVRLID